MAYGHLNTGGRRRIFISQLMLHLLSTTTWLQTYAWTGHWATMPGIDCPKDHLTERSPILSQAKWNYQTESVWASPLTTANNSPSYIHWLPALAKTITWPSLETPQTIQEPLPLQRQWKHMQVFHSSTLLWPTKEWNNPTQMEDSLPLIWTMLHPPSAEAWLQTYAWNGHLDNYMPRTIGHTDSVTIRPPIILHARWNI